MFVDIAWLNRSAVIYCYISPLKRVAKSQEYKGRTAEKGQWSATNCPGVHYLGISLEIPKWHHFVPNLWLLGWQLLKVLVSCVSAAVLQEKLSDLRDVDSLPRGSFSRPGWTKDVQRSTGQGFQYSTPVHWHKGPVASVEPAAPSTAGKLGIPMHVSFPLKKKQYKFWPSATKEKRAPNIPMNFLLFLCVTI